MGKAKIIGGEAFFDDVKEITIPRAWLERLIERAKSLNELMEQDKKSDSFNNCMRIAGEYNGLIGYISSAKDILK